MQIFSFKKIDLKMSSTEVVECFLGFIVLIAAKRINAFIVTVSSNSMPIKAAYHGLLIITEKSLYHEYKIVML